MADTLTPEPTTRKLRARNHHSFYMLDRMAELAHRLAQAEEERTGYRTGAGKIIDRAMQRYAAELAGAGQLGDLLSGNGRDGH